MHWEDIKNMTLQFQDDTLYQHSQGGLPPTHASLSEQSKGEGMTILETLITINDKFKVKPLTTYL